jgi:flagellar hook-associated protein 3 FlgL
MAITRVTQNMMTRHSLESLQSGLGRMARLQEQLSTGRVLNRPSDSPTGTTSAMRLRDTLAATRQHQRNAQDGLAWLGTIDATLTSVADQTRAARDLALQGANTGAVSLAAREALATTVEQIRGSLLAAANTTHLGRPVFGGITAGATAYDPDGTLATGVAGQVERTVAEGLALRVDAEPTAVFGPEGDSVFDHLDALTTALRSGDDATLRTNLDKLNADLDRLAMAHAEVGTRYEQVERAAQSAADVELRLENSLSEVENADLPQVIVDLKMQETAYQAALAATGRVMQPSLLDFLR